MTETKTETKEKKEAKLVEVPTQYQPAIQLENEEVITAMELQVLIYNKLLSIERSLA
jgi:hypothetical protein